MLTVDILFEGIGVQEDLEVLTLKTLEEAAKYVHIPHDPEVSVVFTNDAFIQDLNHQYRHQNKPTNVLSFPLPGDPLKNPALGDIIISLETIGREALDQKKSFFDHVHHMLVHGFLHLLGHDHMEVQEAEIMEGLEIAILQKIGIKNPYLE